MAATAVFEKDLTSSGALILKSFCKAKDEPVVRRTRSSNRGYSSTSWPTQLIGSP